MRLVAILVLALLMPVQAIAKDTAFLRSALIPGTGQAHQGHLKKASLFSGAAILSATGLFVSQVHYNQAVDRMDDAIGVQASIQTRLDNNEIVSIEEIDGNFADLQSAHDESESRLTWRNTFLTALIATYALNLVDVLMSDPHDAETALRYNIETDDRRVLLTRSFRF